MGARQIGTFREVDASSEDSQSVLVEVLERLVALPEIRKVRRIARSAMGISGGRSQRLLDAGCGLGEEARELARVAGPDGEVTAIDLSANLVAAAQQRDKGRDQGTVRYATGNIMALDFPNAVFDAVRCERVMQHLASPDAAVAELVRVTVPGGRVCVIDTDGDSFLMDGVPAGYLAELTQIAARAGEKFRPEGRLLRGRLVRAGLTSVTAEPVTITMTDRHTVQTLHPLFNPRVVHEVFEVPAELADAWFAALDEALANGDFLAVLTLWVVTGTKAS
jgi:ubiquinone/menaquinone biosynthesis C-methylase UbiE